MSELTKLKEQYQTYLQANLNLDMTRGKPSSEQLDLSMALLNDVSRRILARVPKTIVIIVFQPCYQACLK